MGKGADRRADRRQARRDARQERKDSRLMAKNERQALRVSARESNVAQRQLTRQTAYEAGMNPNQFVSDLTNLAGQGITAFTESDREIGDGKGLFGNKDKDEMPKWLLPVGIGVIAVVGYMATK